MDGKIDMVRKAFKTWWRNPLSDNAISFAASFPIDKTEQASAFYSGYIAAISAIDPEDNALKVGRYFCAQMPCSPTDCTEVPCRYMKDAIANRNNRDPEAIRRECAEKAVEYVASAYYGNGYCYDIDSAALRASIISANLSSDDGSELVKIIIEGQKKYTEIYNRLVFAECELAKVERHPKALCDGCWLDDGHMHGACNYCERAKTDLYITEAEIAATDRAAEVKRRLEEAKE